MKIFVIALFVIAFALIGILAVAPVQAQQSCENRINIQVNGLVAITTKPGQSIDNQTLKELITDSGYNVAAIDKGC